MYDSSISGAICVGRAVPFATKYLPFPSIETLATTDRVDELALLSGKSSLMSLGDDMVDAIMKNSNSKKMMSVIDDMENPASTFILFFKAMLYGLNNYISLKK
jgi:hypothetical protein